MPAIIRRHPLLLILAAALLLRLTAAAGVQLHLDRAGEAFLIPGDAEGYWMLAGKIARGEEYSVYDPPRRVLRMPGFPLFLAATRATFGDSFFLTRCALAFVGTGACVTVYLLGTLLRSPQVGLIAAALAACWPALIGFSVLVLSETFFALTLTLSLVCMAWLVKRQRSIEGNAAPFWPAFAAASLTGISIVVASFVRPTWLPATGAFPIAFWLSFGRTWPSAMLAGTVVLAALVTLAPWTIRNRVVTGHWVPTTLWVGPSLYDGLSPSATGESDMRFFDEENLLSRMSEYDMDREYRRRALEFARENPGRAAELAVIKLWRFVRPYPGADQFSSSTAKLLVAGYYLPVVALTLVGTWCCRRDLWLLGLTLSPFLLFAVVHCVFVSSLRYRLPAEYPLCVLSAVGVQALGSAWRAFRAEASASASATGDPDGVPLARLQVP